MSERVSTETCARGCTMHRRHVTDCEDRDACVGCLPRPVEEGRLCYSCHARLREVLRDAPGQYDLLLATVVPSRSQALSARTETAIPDGWRVQTTSVDGESVDPPPARMHAEPVRRPSEGTIPIRAACLDVATELADTLSEWVERLADDYRSTTPPQALTLAERVDPRRRVWREANDYREAGYVWIDPPASFTVPSACRWLTGHLARLTAQEGIGDDLDAIGQVMGRAHALAPWREVSKPLPGVPCPECHRRSLRQYGGSEDVTCTNVGCKVQIPAARYTIWARMYEEDTQAQEAAG